MKILSALILPAALAAVAIAQIPPTPGMPPEAQAAQAFAFAQAQSMMMTNQAQLQGMIASQAAMLSSVQARSMFLGMAASLQARVTANQGAMFSTQAATSAMQHSLALQKQLLVQSAIISLRSGGVESASALQGAAQLALLDPVQSSRRMAMLHAAAAQASGQTSSGSGQTGSGPATSSPTSAQSPSPDAGSLPAEPPPMMIRPTFGNPLVVEKPVFSSGSGTVQPGTKISIRSETHYATLYYTTNGWTPTTQSAKYAGPITINANTHLEVIAVGPNFVRSVVERADYQVPNSPAPALESTVVVPEDGTLRAGTPVRVAFAGKEIDSESAAVGDEITVVLDEQVKFGETVLAPKGAPVHAALTFADPAHGGAPGDLVFEIHAVEIAGKRVPLFGGETLEGAKGVLGSKNAKIKPGMTAMAFVAADTLVK
jgi:Chitobiase/beta-hexosaminidase C-terminal domain